MEQVVPWGEARPVGSRGFREVTPKEHHDSFQGISPKADRLLRALRKHPHMYHTKQDLVRISGLRQTQIMKALDAATRVDSGVAEDDDGRIVYLP